VVVMVVETGTFRPHFARTFRSFVGEDGNLSVDITDSFPVRRAHALEVDRKRVLEAQLAAEACGVMLFFACVCVCVCLPHLFTGLLVVSSIPTTL
jgi:hypothetical protein